MNSQSTLSLVRRSSVAALVAGAALLLGACSTTPVAGVPPGEKTYSESELHQMMVRLAQEPAPGTGPIGATAASSGDLGGNRTLAANP
jgi:hypothetical protein